MRTAIAAMAAALMLASVVRAEEADTTSAIQEPSPRPRVAAPT